MHKSSKYIQCSELWRLCCSRKANCFKDQLNWKLIVLFHPLQHNVFPTTHQLKKCKGVMLHLISPVTKQHRQGCYFPYFAAFKLSNWPIKC